MSIFKMCSLALLLLSLTLPSAAHCAGGNGSSGTGNIFPITDGIAALVADQNALSLRSNRIFDSKTGEALIQLKHVDKSALDRYGDQLVRSRLGSVDGFEYTPRKDADPQQTNHWVVCPDVHSNRCLQLSPLSKTNPKVQAIVGALKSQPAEGSP